MQNKKVVLVDNPSSRGWVFDRFCKLKDVGNFDGECYLNGLEVKFACATVAMRTCSNAVEKLGRVDSKLSNSPFIVEGSFHEREMQNIRNEIAVNMARCFHDYSFGGHWVLPDSTENSKPKKSFEDLFKPKNKVRYVKKPLTKKQRKSRNKGKR